MSYQNAKRHAVSKENPSIYTSTKKRLYTRAGTECHSTNNTRDCKRHGQTRIQDQKIQKISAETNSRRPEVISQKKTLREVTQVKRLQHSRYLKIILSTVCTHVFTYDIKQLVNQIYNLVLKYIT